jgi:hypothetical protein
MARTTNSLRAAAARCNFTTIFEVRYRDPLMLGFVHRDPKRASVRSDWGASIRERAPLPETMGALAPTQSHEPGSSSPRYFG